MTELSRLPFKGKTENGYAWGNKLFTQHNLRRERKGWVTVVQLRKWFPWRLDGICPDYRVAKDANCNLLVNKWRCVAHLLIFLRKKKGMNTDFLDGAPLRSVDGYGRICRFLFSYFFI